MHYCAIWAAASAISLAGAFQDTSPFFLFSTSELLVPSQPNIVSASSIVGGIVSQLKTCPSENYVVVTQANVQAADFASKSNTPHLRRMIQGDDVNIRSSFIVRNVVGDIDTDQLAQILKENCGSELLRVHSDTSELAISNKTSPRVIDLGLTALPIDRSRRDATLADNDFFLSSVISLLPSSKYTVIYTTTPFNAANADPTALSAEKPNNEPDSSYQMDDGFFQSPLHLDLKREIPSTSNRRDTGSDKPILPDGPLFERYSFLSPGLFMGILVTLILLSILYVGINAIAGLQVTYAAFDKEMGPAAQKKAQ